MTVKEFLKLWIGGTFKRFSLAGERADRWLNSTAVSIRMKTVDEEKRDYIAADYFASPKTGWLEIIQSVNDRFGDNEVKSFTFIEGIGKLVIYIDGEWRNAPAYKFVAGRE